MKDLKNEEILKMIENMTVKEVVELIESLEEEHKEHNIPQESDEVKQENFFVMPNFKIKGNHSKPFYQKGRW